MKGRLPKLDNVVPMKADAQIGRQVPEAPDWMADEARRVWGELAGYLVAKDRLRPEYTYQFAAYCESVGHFMACTASLAVEGRFFETSTRNGRQQKKTASWGQMMDAIAAMNRLSALFGLSPVDEARLKVTGQGDLFADLMKQLTNGPD